MKKIAYLLFLLQLLVSCQTQNMIMKKTGNVKTDSTFRYDPMYQYHIRKDDKIEISVWGQDELSVGSVFGIYNSNEVYGKWLQVDASGNIEVPKIGTFNVLNKTIPEVRNTLKLIFATWIVNPIVDVKVLNKEISLLGELKNPGAIKVDKDQNNLLEMISKAGGTEFYANLKKIKVLRQEGTDVRVTTIDLTRSSDYFNTNIVLHPGDIVIVPSKSYKEFDKRISIIIPFATTITAVSIIMGLF